MKDIEQAIASWIEAGMIQIPHLLLQNYKSLGLDEKELIVLLQILSFSDKGIGFPTPAQIASRMTLSEDECSSILRKLMQNGFIKIEADKGKDIISERYSLTPLWYLLAKEHLKVKQGSTIEKKLDNEQNLYTIFEKEFGRPLSPMECESLAMWMDQDHQSPALIKAALREAVISGAVNFRYIDRILFEWKKKGIQTVEEARNHSERFRKKSNNSQQTPQKPTNDVPFYNWLEQ